MGRFLAMKKMISSRLVIAALLALLGTILLACGAAPPPEADVAPAQPDTASAEPPPAEPEPVANTVEVAADGTKFDPPVQVSEIPDGAWMCEMDTVHYASLEPGNGECPVCGMTLKQKSAGEDHHESGATGDGEHH